MKTKPSQTPKPNRWVESYPAYELSETLIRQIEKLVQETNPRLPADHFRRNHVEGKSSTFYLFYQDGQLQGVTAIVLIRAKTPFRKRRLYTIAPVFAYKKPGSRISGMTLDTVFKTLRKKFGFTYLFRPLCLVLGTVNPRVYTQASRFMTEVYPRFDEESPVEVQSFLEDFFWEQAGADLELNPYLMHKGDDAVAEETDVSHLYDKLYKTNYPEINDFYFREGLFEEKEGGVYLSQKKSFMAAYYNPAHFPMVIRKRYLSRLFRFSWKKNQKGNPASIQQQGEQRQVAF